jgi:hypothetical protein
VALAEIGIGSTDLNIPIDDYYPDIKLHLGLPGGSWNFLEEGDVCNMHDAIPIAGCQW